MTYTKAHLREGMTVWNTDGDKLGKISELHADEFMVEKGLFFKKEFLAGYDSIKEIRGDDVILAASRAELTEYGAKGGRFRTGEARIPVAEETLVAEKAKREGEVSVHKEVVTERKQVSVPVTKEEVHVERRPVEREAKPGEATFKEGTVTIPVEEEEIEVKKKPVVREEVVVTKERHPEERVVSGEVRKEHVTTEEEEKRRT